MLLSSRNHRSGALVGGSILVAALSSACCWLPLLAVGLGFSAVGIGTVFERYRVLLLALAAGFLVGAVLLQRRSRRACDGDTCPPPQGSGLVLPIVGGLALLAFAVVPEVSAWFGSSEQVATAADRPDHIVVTYAVQGMTCEGCTGLLVSYLEEQPEIRKAVVDYASGTARVEFMPSTSAPNDVIQRVADDWDTYTFDLLDSASVRPEPREVRP